MRNTYKFLFVITLGLQSCSPKLQPYSAEVNFIYKEATGTIAVKSTGYGNNQTDAVSDAQKNAFKVILFKGLPGTELNIPLIENENEAKLKHSDYFKEFFDDYNYKTFMMSSTESSNLIKMKGLNKITVDVKINYNSLRKDLEQHKLIRKFGL
jgi:hypothetical protein